MKIEKPPTVDRDAYYAEAASWSKDVNGGLRTSRNLAWMIAGAAGVVVVLQAIGLAALIPLKTVVPYTITVDRQTGYLETAQALKPGALSQDAAITQAFLAQYVLARETFDASDLQFNYRKVTQWTVGAARDQYIRSMAVNDPQSPSALYPPTTVVQTTIKSISILPGSNALVRFETERRDGGAGAGERRPYAVVISYRYSGSPMRMEDRFFNPLGFQVTGYRRDAETLGVVSAVRTP